MINRVAASLAPPDTDSCLTALRELAPGIGVAEVRLDLMNDFDLARLISEAPCPLIITCRPPREGGRFGGPEAERLGLLSRALELGCDYVDVEWDSAGELGARVGSAARLIVSRHWYEEMPPRLLPEYDRLKGLGAVVKLVGAARRTADVLPVLELLRHASTPVIAIAMGEPGRLTRLLAPCFPACLLTYGAYDSAGATAPGQLAVAEMVKLYHLHEAGPHTAVELHLRAEGSQTLSAGVAREGGEPGGGRLRLSLAVSKEEAAEVAAGLRACLPDLSLTADAALREVVAS